VHISPILRPDEENAVSDESRARPIQKGRPKPVSPLSHFFFSFDVSFDEEDLIRCNSARNSAVSSSIVLVGRSGKGITSDMVEPPLLGPRRISFSRAIAAFLRPVFFSRAWNPP
jgi:hypothetical protein